MSKHLWEVDHPYYCSESNYNMGGYDNPPHGMYEFDSWEAFVAEWGDADLDMNLVFRWDWKLPETGDDETAEVLWIFWMLQRKGLFLSTAVTITPDDEPAVREWLSERFTHLLKLWEPIATPNPDGGTEA